MSVDRFVGKAVEFKIGETTYKMRCPSAKMLPKLIWLQQKYSSNQTMTEEDFEKIVRIIEDCIRRTYPDWTEDERDDFVVQNFGILQEKLPLTLGLTEKEIEEARKKLNVPNNKPKTNGK